MIDPPDGTLLPRSGLNGHSRENSGMQATLMAPGLAAERGEGRAVVLDEDAALVRAAKAGDQAAFAALFERHHRRVYAMCSRLLRDPAEVEDAVQHAFLEAWRCLDRFEGRSRFSTWITRIAIHTCLGIRRRLRRLFVTDAPPERHEALGWGPEATAPDEGAAHRARREAVHDVLQGLSAKKRVVFVLAELEGMTAPEIAEAIGIPEATVRTRLFHARKEIGRQVREHPGFADLFERPAGEEPR